MNIKAAKKNLDGLNKYLVLPDFLAGRPSALENLTNSILRRTVGQ